MRAAVTASVGFEQLYGGTGRVDLFHSFRIDFSNDLIMNDWNMAV